MEVLDPSGHVRLTWDPEDPESVKRAESEFNRMRESGFAFFVSESPDADRVEGLDPETGSLDGRLVQVKEFRPRARRTAAVPPLRGG